MTQRKDVVFESLGPQTRLKAPLTHLELKKDAQWSFLFGVRVLFYAIVYFKMIEMSFKFWNNNILNMPKFGGKSTAKQQK